MQARMKNPAMIVPDALQALQTLAAATEKAGVPPRTLALAHLRASQINGCSVCVDMARLAKKKTGETEERLFAVAAWREMPYFSDAGCGLGRGRAPLRREGARGAGAVDRHDQRLEPAQRRGETAGGAELGLERRGGPTPALRSRYIPRTRARA